MDVELLRTFLEVNRTRHFGRAAEELYLTQSAVSARIKLLEGQLGVQLFERRKRDIRLTPEGNRLVRHAETLIAQWRKARQDVAAGDPETDQIAVGGMFSMWDVLLQEWLHQVYRDIPNLAIIAESYGADLLRRRVLDGVLDMVFMYEPPQLEELMIEEVATLELVMVTDDQEQDLDEALQDNYVMVDWGLAHALQHNRLLPQAYVHRFRFGQARSALEFLRTFGGSAYVPRRLVQEELENDQLHIVPDAPVIERKAYAIYTRYSPRRHFIERTLQSFHRL